MNNSHLTIEEIPWSRIVHWYGRATEYPQYFKAIRNGTKEQQKEAIYKIKTTIEHQDGIIYVTPIALPFIFDLLTEEKTDKIGLLEIIEVVIRAVNFEYEYFEIDKAMKKLSVKQLLDEEHLWPEFKSKDEDDFLWEEYTCEPQYWLELTAGILLLEEVKIKQLELTDSAALDLVNKILEENNKLRCIITE